MKNFENMHALRINVTQEEIQFNELEKSNKQPKRLTTF